MNLSLRPTCLSDPLVASGVGSLKFLTLRLGKRCGEREGFWKGFLLRDGFEGGGVHGLFFGILKRCRLRNKQSSEMFSDGFTSLNRKTRCQRIEIGIGLDLRGVKVLN